MDAQTDIEGRPGAPGRSAVFDSVASFADNCAADASVSAATATATATAEHLHAGLCQSAAAGAPALWQLIALDAQQPGATVEYGRFTGAIMASGAGMLPVRRPRYLVELLPSHLPGEEAGTTAEGAGGGASTGHLYRITAIGFGAQADTQVVLQSYYRKRAGSTPVSGAGP